MSWRSRPSMAEIALTDDERHRLKVAAARIPFVEGYPKADETNDRLDEIAQNARRYQASLEKIHGSPIGDSLGNRDPHLIAESLDTIRRMLKAISHHPGGFRPPRPKRDGRYPRDAFRMFIAEAKTVFEAHTGKPANANNATDKFIMFVQAFYPKAQQYHVRDALDGIRGKEKRIKRGKGKRGDVS